MNVSLILPNSPQAQVVDLGYDGSKESESIESDEVTKKSTEIEKVPKASKIISQVLKNSFSSATKTFSLIKRKMFGVDTLGTASKVIDIESWLEDTLDQKRKRKEGVPKKENLSLAVYSISTLSKVKKQNTCQFLDKILI